MSQPNNVSPAPVPAVGGSTCAIAAFAGEDIEVAKYYPEDRDFLLEFEPHVVHYDVSAQASA